MAINDDLHDSMFITEDVTKGLVRSLLTTF